MRRQYIIDKDFQFKFILKFCGVVVLAAIILAALVIWFADNSTTVTIENTKVVVKNTVDFIYPVLFQSFVFAAIFSGISVAVMTMLMTHRIAGPLYRLRIDVERIKEGDYRAEFKIRKSDQLGEFAKSISEMSSTLRSRNAALKNDVIKLRRALDNTEIDNPEITEHLSKIEESLNNLKL